VLTVLLQFVCGLFRCVDRSYMLTLPYMKPDPSTDANHHQSHCAVTAVRKYEHQVDRRYHPRIGEYQCLLHMDSSSSTGFQNFHQHKRDMG